MPDKYRVEEDGTISELVRPDYRAPGGGTSYWRPIPKEEKLPDDVPEELVRQSGENQRTTRQKNYGKEHPIKPADQKLVNNLYDQYIQSQGNPAWSQDQWATFYEKVCRPVYDNLNIKYSDSRNTPSSDDYQRYAFVFGALSNLNKKFPNSGYAKELADMEVGYYRITERATADAYQKVQQQLHTNQQNVAQLQRTVSWLKYYAPLMPLSSRPKWASSLKYAEGQLAQKQQHAQQIKVASIKKQQELASIKKQQEVASTATGGTTSGGSDEISEANKTKTTETPNKPTAKAEEKKDPDEELNDIMTMAMNLEKMQDAGADVGIVNFVARRLAQRIAALEGGPGGMSEEQFQRLPSQMRSPMAAMINRARYESAQKKRIDDYYEKTHQIPPNYVKNLDRLPNDMRKSILNNWNPSEIPQNEVAAAMKNLPKGRGYSVGNSYFDESKSKSISDTPQMNSSQPSMSYSPYGTSYQEFGNLSPGQDMSGMFGYNQTLNNMMSRTSTSPYTVS